MAHKPRSRWVQRLMQLGTAVFFAVLLLLCWKAWRMGLFRSLDTLQTFVASYEVGAPLVFLLLQVLCKQVFLQPLQHLQELLQRLYPR